MHRARTRTDAFACTHSAHYAGEGAHRSSPQPPNLLIATGRPAPERRSGPCNVPMAPSENKRYAAASPPTHIKPPSLRPGERSWFARQGDGACRRRTRRSAASCRRCSRRTYSFIERLVCPRWPGVLWPAPPLPPMIGLAKTAKAAGGGSDRRFMGQARQGRAASMITLSEARLFGAAEESPRRRPANICSPCHVDAGGDGEESLISVICDSPDGNKRSVSALSKLDRPHAEKVTKH